MKRSYLTQLMVLNEFRVAPECSHLIFVGDSADTAGGWLTSRSLLLHDLTKSSFSQQATRTTFRMEIDESSSEEEGAKRRKPPTGIKVEALPQDLDEKTLAKIRHTKTHLEPRAPDPAYRIRGLKANI